MYLWCVRFLISIISNGSRIRIVTIAEILVLNLQHFLRQMKVTQLIYWMKSSYLDFISICSSGLFECRVRNEAGYNKYMYNVIVFCPPIIKNATSNSTTIKAISAEDFSFNCQADGYPTPDVRTTTFWCSLTIVTNIFLIFRSNGRMMAKPFQKMQNYTLNTLMYLIKANIFVGQQIVVAKPALCLT